MMCSWNVNACFQGERARERGREREKDNFLLQKDNGGGGPYYCGNLDLAEHKVLMDVRLCQHVFLKRTISLKALTEFLSRLCV